MTRYEVKPEYRMFVIPQLLGTLVILKDNPSTCEYLMQNNNGDNIKVTYEFFSECMKPSPYPFSYSRFEPTNGVMP